MYFGARSPTRESNFPHLELYVEILFFQFLITTEVDTSINACNSTNDNQFLKKALQIFQLRTTESNEEQAIPIR